MPAEVGAPGKNKPFRKSEGRDPIFIAEAVQGPGIRGGVAGIAGDKAIQGKARQEIEAGFQILR